MFTFIKEQYTKHLSLQLQLEGTVDVFRTVLRLRRQRSYMIQDADQYHQIYTILARYLKDTNI